MNSEVTIVRDVADLQGWLLYDADCPFCAAWAARWENLLTRRGFDLAPLQSPWVRECLDLSLTEPFSAMHLVTVQGEDFAGADAVLYLSRRIWWAWPLFLLSLAPGATLMLRASYRWLAARRGCLGGACRDAKSLARTSARTGTNGDTVHLPP